MLNKITFRITQLSNINEHAVSKSSHKNGRPKTDKIVAVAISAELWSNVNVSFDITYIDHKKSFD